MWKYHGQMRPPFAEQPGDGQESVWDYPRPPRLELDSRRVEVRLGEIVIAETRNACRILETASPPTFYIPPEDVRCELLEPTPGKSFCEWKGAADYWQLSSAPRSALAIGWSYPRPSPRFRAIVEHFSFYPGRVECYVDGERVQPQPGGFYGGWLTSEVVGPVKGAPGTSHW